MNLHTDIPTRVQVDQLLDNRRPASVSIYLSTDPVSNGQAERIELGNLASEAERQLVEAGTAKAEVAAVADSLADLIDDSEFWRFQARSLAVFVTPDSARQVIDPRPLPEPATPRIRRPEGADASVCPRRRPGAASPGRGARRISDPRRGRAARLDLPVRLDLSAPGRLEHHRQPETRSDTELAAARAVLDELNAAALSEVHELYRRRESESRAAADLAVIARAATFGVVDEIVRRIWQTGGTVLAVRREDVPGGGPAAAILRHALGSEPGLLREARERAQ